MRSTRCTRSTGHRSADFSIRNDPDGRNRVNINSFTGDLFVTDFADIPTLGNISTDRLADVFERWQQHPVFVPYNCYSPEVGCTGPNLIVAHMYHAGVDFRTRKAILPEGASSSPSNVRV
ncbi:MAG: hypothetical protein JWN15_185 [Firmicutes bacterium]|nr:hypothetical protein [Bacillota bacterium]